MKWSCQNSYHLTGKTFSSKGFTELRKYTPHYQKKNQMSDYALVITFKPFRGKLLQALWCFLSKAAASRTIFYPILIEASYWL